MAQARLDDRGLPDILYVLTARQLRLGLHVSVAANRTCIKRLTKAAEPEPVLPLPLTLTGCSEHGVLVVGRERRAVEPDCRGFDRRMLAA
jgi:hypothetical protein